MKKKPRVVLDTNIIVSAILYGGKPEQIYNLVLENQITAITSITLIAELVEILIKKFNFDLIKIEQLEKIIKKHFKVIHPKETINVTQDQPDNRVLEAAVEGSCDFIITGDKDLLDLKVFKKISKASLRVKILTADQFLIR